MTFPDTTPQHEANVETTSADPGCGDVDGGRAEAGRADMDGIAPCRQSTSSGQAVAPVTHFFLMDHRSSSAVNVIFSLVLLVWIATISKLKRQRTIWRGWVAWALFTAMFYMFEVPVCQEVDPSPPFVFEYIATAALLSSFVLSSSRARIAVRRGIVLSWSVVLATVVADIAVRRFANTAGFAMALRAVVFFLWGWRVRDEDPTKSVPFILYGLAQLPIQPVLASLHLTKADEHGWCTECYAVFALLKLALFVPVKYVSEQAQTRQQFFPTHTSQVCRKRRKDHVR